MSKKILRITCLIALFLIVSKTVSFLLQKTTLGDETQTYLAKTIFGIIITIYSLIIIRKLKYSYLVGIVRPSFQLLFLYICPFYIAFLINLSNWNKLTVTQLFFPFIGVFFHAFAEELTIRGIILPTLIEKSEITPKSIKIAIIVSAIIFGLVHLISLLDYDLLSVITQVVYATIHGLFFGILLVKGRNIYLLSLSHAIINFLNRIKHINQPPIVIADTNDSQSLLLTIILTIVIFSPLIFVSLLYITRISTKDVANIRLALSFKQ